MGLPTGSLTRLLAGATAVCLICSVAGAQDRVSLLPRIAPRTLPDSDLRQYAPGALISAPVGVEVFDTHYRRSFSTELQAAAVKWTPNNLPVTETLAAMAADATVRRTVWGLEFRFKPVRMISVDMPSGPRQAWYLLYNVRNLGGHLQPVRQDDGLYQVEAIDDVGEPIYFRPTFELFSYEFSQCYLDEPSPEVLAAIRKREDPNRPLVSSAEMAATPIPLQTEDDDGLWGAAIWGVRRPIDRRIDFFSVFVGGLTNAVRPNQDGVMEPKLLQLNFWRPGDSVGGGEDEIRFGVPRGEQARYGMQYPNDARWVYAERCSTE